MKKTYKYLFTFIICLFVAPLITKADCSYERQAELSRIAANVRFSYTYEIKNEEPIFYLNVVNLTPDIYIIDEYNGTNISGIGEKITEYIYVPKATFTIYSNDPVCRNEKIMTQYVNMPMYNVYAEKEECRKNPNFKFCQMWGNKPDTEEQFENELDTYLKNEINDEAGEKSSLSIVEFLEQNKTTLILIIAGIIILIICTVINKRQRR